mgnify:CR=1 FL=1
MLNMVPRILDHRVKGSKSRRRRDFSRNRACFVVLLTTNKHYNNLLLVYNTVATTVGVIMENIKHFGIGAGLFALLTLAIMLVEYITVDLMSLNSEQVGTGLMIVALLLIAKPFGELSVSVYNNNIKKQ